MNRLRIKIHMVGLVALSLLAACTRGEEELLPVDGETRFSVVTNVPAGTDVSGADVIRNATVFLLRLLPVGLLKKSMLLFCRVDQECAYTPSFPPRMPGKPYALISWLMLRPFPIHWIWSLSPFSTYQGLTDYSPGIL